MTNGFLDRLLDRLLTPAELKFSWRYALRIILITSAFHAGGLIIVGITEPIVQAEGFSLRDAGYLLFAVGFCIIPYWAVFVLAGFSDANKPARSWRVRVAWLLITYPLAGFYLMTLFGDRTDAASGMAFAVIILTSLSPALAIVGAFAGYLLWLLYRWLRTMFREDEGKANQT